MYESVLVDLTTSVIRQDTNVKMLVTAVEGLVGLNQSLAEKIIDQEFRIAQLEGRIFGDV